MSRRRHGFLMAGAVLAAALAPSGRAQEIPLGPGRGFPAREPWVSYYGLASGIDPARVARRFRIINIDADPDLGNFTAEQIAALRSGGQNRVISYLNVGACEAFRSYYKTVPPGFVSCGANAAAQLGPYRGYPDETWMNPANPDYQKLLVEHVARRLAAQGADGFFLDNLEIVEHGTGTTNGPCDGACSQGGLDLVRRLREAFPGHLIVMQNATSDVTRLGTTGGVAVPRLIDGISRESTYAPVPDPEAEAQLILWLGMRLTPGDRPFWVATEDYVGSCSNVDAARAIYATSRARGFAPYVTDASAGQQVICYWPFEPTVSIDDRAVAEGTATNAAFRVALSTASAQSVTVDYATADSTAMAGSDYSATSGKLTFTPGRTQHSMFVPIVSDTTAEGRELFLVNLSNPTNATLDKSQGVGEILDPPVSQKSPMYRAYNKGTDYHFFTTDKASKDFAVNVLGFQDESTPVPFYVSNGQLSATVPLFRMYNPNLGRHFYTASTGSRDFLMGIGAVYEKEEGFVYPLSTIPQPPGTTELFLLYNNNSGTHLFTADPAQKDGILNLFKGVWVQHTSVGFVFTST